MWTVIYIAPNQAEAERLRRALAEEGFLVQVRRSAKKKPDGVAHFELAVPDGEADDAHEVLHALLGRR